MGTIAVPSQYKCVSVRYITLICLACNFFSLLGVRGGEVSLHFDQLSFSKLILQRVFSQLRSILKCVKPVNSQEHRMKAIILVRKCCLNHSLGLQRK